MMKPYIWGWGGNSKGIAFWGWSEDVTTNLSRKLSWYFLNSDIDVQGSLPISRVVTESVSGTLPISRHIHNSVAGTLEISRKVWGFVSGTLPISRHIHNNVSGTLNISRMIYDSLSGKIKVTFKAAKRITEFFGSGDQTGDKKKSRMR